MKWGVRRYQPYSLIPRKSGKTGKNIGQAKKTSKSRLSNSLSGKGKKSNNKKELFRPKPKKLNDRDKEKLIRSGSPKEIKQYSSQLSNRELREALDRVSLEKRLSDLTGDTKKTGKERIDAAFKNVGDLNSKANTVIDSYNTFAKVYNSLNSEPIPTIGGSYKKQTPKALKKVVNEGTAEEVYKYRKQMSMDDWKKANNRFAQEKATREAMQRDREWEKEAQKERTKREQQEQKEQEERTKREQQERMDDMNNMGWSYEEHRKKKR